MVANTIENNASAMPEKADMSDLFQLAELTTLWATRLENRNVALDTTPYGYYDSPAGDYNKDYFGLSDSFITDDLRFLSESKRAAGMGPVVCFVIGSGNNPFPEITKSINKNDLGIIVITLGLNKDYFTGGKSLDASGHVAFEGNIAQEDTVKGIEEYLHMLYEEGTINEPKVDRVIMRMIGGCSLLPLSENLKSIRTYLIDGLGVVDDLLTNSEKEKVLAILAKINALPKEERDMLFNEYLLFFMNTWQRVQTSTSKLFGEIPGGEYAEFVQSEFGNPQGIVGRRLDTETTITFNSQKGVSPEVGGHFVLARA